MGSPDAALTLRWPWLVMPAVGPVRVTTILTAIAIAAIVIWRRRSPLLALIAVMAWAAAYEIAFNLIGTLLHGWPAGSFVWLGAALAGWVVLAQWRGVVPDWRFAAATGVGALGWVVTTGFAVNAPATDQGFSPLAELFNESTKVLLGVAYLVGALRSR